MAFAGLAISMLHDTDQVSVSSAFFQTTLGWAEVVALAHCIHCCPVSARMNCFCSHAQVTVPIVDTTGTVWVAAHQTAQLGPALHLALSLEDSCIDVVDAHSMATSCTAAQATGRIEWMEVIHFVAEEVRSRNPETD